MPRKHSRKCKHSHHHEHTHNCEHTHNNHNNHLCMEQTHCMEQTQCMEQTHCIGNPYAFNPKFSYSRMINPSQLKTMLDNDTNKNIVLTAVPFWPQNAVLWTKLDPSIGITPAHTRYSTYIQYTVGSRTYQSIQFDWLSEVANISLPLRYYNVPSKDAFQTTLRNKNITSNNIIVLYDDTVAPNGTINSSNNAVNRLAMRAMMVLQYFCYDNVYFLNGGDQEWFKAAIPGSSTNISHLPYVGAPSLSTNYVLGPIAPGAAPDYVPEPAPIPSNHAITNERYSYLVSREEVVAERLNPCTILVDARPYKMYVGTQQGGLVQSDELQKVRRLGHVKGAVNVAWPDLLDILEGANGIKYTRLKSTSELSQIMIDAKAIVGNKKIITMCNEGIHGTMAWFIIDHLLDYPLVRIYEGSTAEWADGAFVFENGSPSGVLIAQGIERYPMLSGLEDN